MDVMVTLHTGHPILRDRVMSRLTCYPDLMGLYRARILP